MSQNSLNQLENAQQVQAEVKGSGGKMNNLLRANALSYTLPNSLSVISRRTQNRNFFNKSSYSPGESMVCTLNGSDTFIDGGNSYLSFEIKLVTDAGAPKTATFGNSSVINILNRLVMTSEAGVEVDRVEGINVYAPSIDRVKLPQEYFDGFGNATMQYPIGAVATSLTTGGVVVCIPLSKLSGMWGTSKLTPGALASGLRLEFTLQDKDTALVWSAAPGAADSYVINNPVIVTDNYTLNDSILKELNKQTANVGLEVAFETYDRTPASMGTSQVVLNQTARKSVARAMWVAMKGRDSKSAVSGTRGVADSFVSEAFDVSAYRFRLGSLHFPSSEVTKAREAYFNLQYAFDKVKNPHNTTQMTWAKFDATDSLIATTLSTSNVLTLSGLPTSGSRQMECNVTYGSANPNGRTIDIFLGYIKVIKVYLNRQVVKE